MSEGDVAEPSLAPRGKMRIEWADRQMPVLAEVRRRFVKDKPLSGARVAACLHVTPETAVLMKTLQAGGAEVRLCASNPLSTQDDVAASLVADLGVPTFAVNGEEREPHQDHVAKALAAGPSVTMDDGGDLAGRLHSERHDLIEGVRGGTEVTTTGVIRLRGMAAEGTLRYPIIAVTDPMGKSMLDDRHGTGQSTLDGILRATGTPISGRTVVVAGYGRCGRGVALRGRGLGGHVIVTEVDPIRALEAVMDGFRVMPMDEAASLGDIFITVTGNRHVLRGEHFRAMKDGAILASLGHFDEELELPAIEKLSRSSRVVRRHVREYAMADGRRIHLLGEGRLISPAAPEGRPAAVMDMLFASHALAAEHIVGNADKLENRVYGVPGEIDREIARLKLAALGFALDALTRTQAALPGSRQVPA